MSIYSFTARYIACSIGVVLADSMFSLFSTENLVEIITSYRPYILALIITIALTIRGYILD